MLKRALQLVICITIVSIVGCEAKKVDSPTTQSSGAKVKIGFIVKQPDAQWFQLEWKFAQQAADANGFELIKIGATDGEKVMAAIDNLATSDAQGFVICTPDVKLGPAIMNQAKIRGLKVLAVDDQFIGSDGKPMADVVY